MKPYLKIISYGGVNGRIVDNVNKNIEASQFDWTVDWEPVNANVDVSRAKAAESFLRSDCDVLIMQDNDTVCGYGDHDHMALKCSLQECVVGTCYSKRSFHQGLVLAIHDGVYHEVGSDDFFEVKDGFIGTGLIAIHRFVLNDIGRYVDDCVEIATGYHTFFLPRVTKTMWQGESVGVQLNDDYSFCARVREAGRRIFVTMRPIVGHVGETIFSPIEAQLGQSPPTKRSANENLHFLP